MKPQPLDPVCEYRREMTRRHFFNRSGVGLGTAALATLLNEDGRAAASDDSGIGLPELPHFAPKAKRVIYLFQSGGPSQLDLFDHKPELLNHRGAGPARLGARRATIDGDDRSSIQLPDGSVDVQVRATRGNRARR